MSKNKVNMSKEIKMDAKLASDEVVYLTTAIERIGNRVKQLQFEINDLNKNKLTIKKILKKIKNEH